MSLLELLTLIGCFVVGMNCGYLVAIPFRDLLGRVSVPVSMLLGGVIGIVALYSYALPMMIRIVKTKRIPPENVPIFLLIPLLALALLAFYLLSRK